MNGGSVANYVYDAEGQRVRKTTSGGSVDYLYDLSGHVITELSSSGGWNRGEIYAGSMHLATYANGTTYFTHSDWLGDERVRSTVSGAVYSLWSNLPFGEGSSSVNPGPTHFTGKERDTETVPPSGGNGLDYFGARYYSSTMGRFMTPDWADKPTDVPYSDFGDPQSLNLYGYVRNNPMTHADADGHETAIVEDAQTALDFGARFGKTLQATERVLSHPAVQAIIMLAGFGAGGEAGAAEGGLIEGATSRAEQLGIDKATGKAFEKVVVDATKKTDTNVVEQVTVKTESGVKTRVDAVSTDSSGQIRLQEAKGSQTAPLTPNQAAAHPEIQQTGATVVGQGKPPFSGGTQIPPTQVQVVRPKNPSDQ